MLSIANSLLFHCFSIAKTIALYWQNLWQFYFSFFSIWESSPERFPSEWHSRAGIRAGVACLFSVVKPSKLFAAHLPHIYKAKKMCQYPSGTDIKIGHLKYRYSIVYGDMSQTVNFDFTDIFGFSGLKKIAPKNVMFTLSQRAYICPLIKRSGIYPGN